MSYPQPSPMSIHQLVHSAEDSHKNDRDVQLAAEALGTLASLDTGKRSFPSLVILPPLTQYASAPSTTPSSPLPTPGLTTARYSFSSESTDDDIRHIPQHHFIHRVSNIPLVHSALRAYESSKASSSVVKYGAEMVESLAAPIYDKFGRRVLSDAVDEWGCKQLDKLEERYPSYVTCTEEKESSVASALACASLSDDYEREGHCRRRREESYDDEPYVRSRSHSRSASCTSHPSTVRSTSPRRVYTKTQRHRHPARSKWHQIVMHAGTAAGTTAAVVSEESMKCLRYCLSWLQYATQHIDHQMNILRSLVVALATHPHAHQNTPTHTTHTTHTTNTLSEIKREIIDTLRKVVEVVSKYAGTGLPEQAKASVRGFILALPGRWAVLNAGNQANESKVNETSIRLLNFGGESIEMLQSVSNVFAATIERAELWLERLRGVGVTANHPATTTVTTATTANTTTTTQPPTPPTHTSHDAMDLS